MSRYCATAFLITQGLLCLMVAPFVPEHAGLAGLLSLASAGLMGWLESM